MDYFIYNSLEKKIYTQELKLIPLDDPVYEILQKYKIPPNLINIKIYAKNINEADNGLVFTGVFPQSKGVHFCYGTEHIKKRKNKKNLIFLKIYKLKTKIYKEIRDLSLTQKEDIILIKILILLLFESGMRLGKREFKNKFGTIGAISLEKKHLTILTNKIKINFIGKRKVENFYEITDTQLQTELKKLCKKRKLNEELFPISEYKINNFLNKFDITAKDIRSFKLNFLFLNQLLKIKDLGNKKLKKEQIKLVAEKGCHSATICKNSYLSDKIIELLLITKNKLTTKMIIKYLEKEEIS